jgi:SnoaL-like domain
MPETSEPPEITLVREGLGVLGNDGPDALMDRYDEFFADDFQWRPILLGSVEGERVFIGREQFALYWREFTDAFGSPGLGDLTHELIGPGRILVSGRIIVTGVGSGVPIDREVAYVFEVADGLITSASSFLSRREAEEFLAHA